MTNTTALLADFAALVAAASVSAEPRKSVPLRPTRAVQTQPDGVTLVMPRVPVVTTSDDGVRLWADGKQVVDDWNVYAARTEAGTVRLAAHSRHGIRMEYSQNTRDAVARLGWRLPNGSPTLAWASEVADTIVETRRI